MGALGVTADKVAMDGLLDQARRAAFSQQHIELDYNPQAHQATVLTHTVDGRPVPNTPVQIVDADHGLTDVGYRATVNGAVTVADFGMDKSFDYQFAGGRNLSGRCSISNGRTLCDGRLTAGPTTWSMHSESNLQTGFMGAPENPNHYLTVTTYSSPEMRAPLRIAETVQITGNRLVANVYKNPSDIQLANLRRDWGR